MLRGAKLGTAWTEAEHGFSDPEIEHTDLREAILVGADLTGADLEGAYSMSQYVAPMQQGLSALREQLDRIELRQRSVAIIEADERRAVRENHDAVLEIVKTWRTTEQKALSVAAKIVRKLGRDVLGEVVGLAVDAAAEATQAIARVADDSHKGSAR